MLRLLLLLAITAAEICIKEDITWDHGDTNVVQFQVNIDSAPICQDRCFYHDSCSNFTWYSSDSPTFSRICVLYSHIPASTYPCKFCVSGPKVCEQTTTESPPPSPTTTTEAPITTTTAAPTTTITTTIKTTTTTTTNVPTTTTPTTTVKPTTTTTAPPTTTTTPTTTVKPTTTTTAPPTTTTTLTTTVKPTTTTAPPPTTTTPTTTVKPTTTTIIPTTKTTTPTTTTTTPATTTMITTTLSTTTSTDKNCNSDCRCQDWTYDQCHAPHPTTAVHTLNFKECMRNCEIFATEGRCNFIIFLNTNVDENCLIMEDDLEKYLRGCHIKGQPLYQGDNELMQDCSNCPDCGENCVSCQDTPCAGYADMECDFTHQSDSGSDQNSFGECVDFCKHENGETYAYYEGTDTKKCHCYNHGGRDCKSFAMTLEAEDCANRNS